MKSLLSSLSRTLPLLLLACGCATDVSQGEDPIDNDLEPAISPDALLTSLSAREVPEARPFTSSVVYGGSLALSGRYRGEGWTLAFAPGTEASWDTAQILQTAQRSAEDFQGIDATWSTEGFAVTARAGALPSGDDLFTLFLNAYSTTSEGESRYDATDAIQVRLDNTPPISRITRICRDAEGTDCFGFTANPSDVGAANSATDIFQVSRTAAPRLYVHGIARDKNFTLYQMHMVGGQASSGSFLCESGEGKNAACTGDLATVPDTFGYGLARGLSYEETLAASDMIDAYSDDTLLLIWDISYLTPDAYALSLQTFSAARMGGDDDPVSLSNWATLLIQP